MRIIDGNTTVEIPDGDPLVLRIRALLYQQPDRDPIQLLWDKASGPLRDVLVVIAKSGDIAQVDLEQTLGVTGIGLRGRNSALARIAKSVGVEYPIKKTGGRREHRRFSLAPDIVREILGLSGLK